MDKAKIIACIPLFKGLSDIHCQNIGSIAILQIYARGQMFFFEGDCGIGFYVILSGKVKIFKLSTEGKEQILHILEAHEPFGEAVVFAGENYPASAQALAETRVLFFPRQKFVGLIRREPSLALSMLALLAQRLRKLTKLVENLSLKEAPSRMAAYLLFLSEQKNSTSNIDLDITKNQLAGLLGTIPETVSRILKRMTEEKIIRANGKKISILDRHALAKLAQGAIKLT